MKRKEMGESERGQRGGSDRVIGVKVAKGNENLGVDLTVC